MVRHLLMKRFESAWNMSRTKKAFTLTEVMLSVMIISIVIMALLQMHGNTTHIFSKFTSQLKISQYASVFISDTEYGFEKKSLELSDLLNDFKVEDDLRRELKSIKIEIMYKELERIDMSEIEDASSKVIFEIGKTILKVNDSSASLVRFRIQ